MTGTNAHSVTTLTALLNLKIEDLIQQMMKCRKGRLILVDPQNSYDVEILLLMF